MPEDIKAKLQVVEKRFQELVQASYKVAEENVSKRIAKLREINPNADLEGFAKLEYETEVKKLVAPLINNYQIAVSHITMDNNTKAFEANVQKMTQYFAKENAEYKGKKLKTFIEQAKILGVPENLLTLYAQEMQQKGGPGLFSPLSSAIKHAMKSYSAYSPVRKMTKYQAKAVKA